MLRNPKVVIVLAVVASLLLFRNLFSAVVPHLSFSFHKKPPAPVAMPVQALSANLNTAPALLDALPPNQRIDLSQLDWAKFRSPRRDPFASVARAGAPSTSSGAQAGSAQGQGSTKARESLELKAVWLQDSGRLAVINDQIVGEGDSVLGFKIQKIQAGGVVVQGVEGLESLGFTRRTQPAGGTNNAAGKPATAPAPNRTVGL